MLVKPNIILAAIIGQLIFTNAVNAQSIDYAIELYKHGLSSEAKLTFIQILYEEESTDFEMGESLYWLGTIAFTENNYLLAKEDWARLIYEFPNSNRIVEITDNLNILEQQLAEIHKEQFTLSIALSFIENGDFWCNSPEEFLIGLPSLTHSEDDVEMGIYWYDRVIAEFPGTPEAEYAYVRKLKALRGWNAPIGGYGGGGAELDPETYMPQLIEAFKEFEAAFPESIYLQHFRYQIAELYWYPMKDWENAAKWCNIIIEAAGGETTDYSQMAEWIIQDIGN